jgi:hypothetical protein
VSRTLGGSDRWWILGAIVLGLSSAVAATAILLRRPPHAAPLAAPKGTTASAPAAGLAERALVAPLAPGSDLAGFTVREIHGVWHGVMRVVLVKGAAEVRLDVALADPEAPAAPAATAGRYAIFYAIHGASPEDGERLAQKLGELISTHAAEPAPPGMTVFEPKPKPGTAL